MFGMGVQELLVILIICLLIFGAGKLPEIGKALGKAINEFKEEMKDAETDKLNEPKRPE